jgi:ribonuclease VapC
MAATAEPAAGACKAALEAEVVVLISAGTVAEALIVAARRGVGQEMDTLIVGLGFEVVLVDLTSARQVAQAYAAWGKGVHPAALNFGDGFAYALAKARGCRLLHVGDDFAKTDVERAS